MILFFLLAGGYGKRARPLSLMKPKPLFPLHGIPLIDLMLNQLQKKGLTRGFVNLHYRPESIRPHLRNRPDITCFFEDRLSGSAILSRSADYLGNDFLLVVNGDVYLEIPIDDMSRHLIETRCDGVLLIREGDVSRYSRLNVREDRYLGMAGSPAGEWMYTGVSLFRKGVAREIKMKNFFRLLDSGRFDIRTISYRGIWLDIGDVRSYYRSNTEYRRHTFPGTTDTNSLSENVTISPGCTVEESIIWENTRITDHSRISRCIITGNMDLESVCQANRIVTGGGVYKF